MTIITRSNKSDTSIILDNIIEINKGDYQYPNEPKHYYIYFIGINGRSINWDYGINEMARDSEYYRIINSK